MSAVTFHFQPMVRFSAMRDGSATFADGDTITDIRDPVSYAEQWSTDIDGLTLSVSNMGREKGWCGYVRGTIPPTASLTYRDGLVGMYERWKPNSYVHQNVQSTTAVLTKNNHLYLAYTGKSLVRLLIWSKQHDKLIIRPYPKAVVPDCRVQDADTDLKSSIGARDSEWVMLLGTPNLLKSLDTDQKMKNELTVYFQNYQRDSKQLAYDINQLARKHNVQGNLSLMAISFPHNQKRQSDIALTLASSDTVPREVRSVTEGFLNSLNKWPKT